MAERWYSGRSWARHERLATEHALLGETVDQGETGG